MVRLRFRRCPTTLRERADNMLIIHQTVIFILGWSAYASTYLLRKPIGVIKSAVQSDLKLSTAQLGWFDVSLLLPYAVAQILLGSLGDQFGSRRVLSLCLVASGLSMITFGAWNNMFVLCLLLFLNGLAQSQCWPNCTKILSSWFKEEQKNTIFGFFGTCAFAGGIMGTALAVYLEQRFDSWRAVHYIPSMIVVALGVLCYLLYRDSVESKVVIESSQGNKTADTMSTPSPSFRELVALPAVAEISFAVFCLKLVRYCMYMWLPLYLEKQLSYTASSAGLFSTMFEIGGVVGSALFGLLLDRCCSSRPLYGVTISIAASAVSLVLFNMTAKWSYTANSLCMLLAGAFNCGPDTILGAAIPNKIGQQGGMNCASAVTGVVNGFGSLGTVIEGPLIAWVSNAYGWSRMFTLMVLLTVLGAGATVKASWSIQSISKSESNDDNQLQLV